MTKILLFCIALGLAFTSCQPEVSFRQAQPADATVLNEFPTFLCGRYLNNLSGAVLQINPDGIVQHYITDTKMNKKELDSSYVMKDSFLENVKTGLRIPITVMGDTIIQHVAGVDSIFRFGKGHVLKSMKGYYFLNTQFDDSTWEVKQLSLEKGQLSMAHVAYSSTKDFNTLKVISHSPADSASRRFDPSKKEFKGFVKKGGFNRDDKFTRIH